jgi:hypothetical protein
MSRFDQLPILAADPNEDTAECIYKAVQKSWLNRRVL